MNLANHPHIDSEVAARSFKYILRPLHSESLDTSVHPFSLPQGSISGVIPYHPHDLHEHHVGIECERRRYAHWRLRSEVG